MDMISSRENKFLRKESSWISKVRSYEYWWWGTENIFDADFKEGEALSQNEN
jgi:hypothetical protein